MRDLGVYRWILHIYFDYVQIPEFFFSFLCCFNCYVFSIHVKNHL